MNIRDRVKELRRVPASSLRPSPFNWRTHPKAQLDALRGVLAEVGYAGAALARELADGSLELIDGHARAETCGDALVPVLVLDVTEAEAKKILATFDPLGAMAEADAGKLDALLKDVETSNAAVAEMLDALAHEHGVAEAVEPGGGGDEFDATPEGDGPTRAKAGELWVIGGKHRLIVGDCTDPANVARLMGGAKADCVFTSPPYGVGVDYGTYQDTFSNLRSMLPKLAATWLDVVKPGGFAVVNFNDIASGRDIAEVDEPCEYPMALEYWPAFRAAGWVLWSRRVWVKKNAAVNSLWCIQSNRGAADWEHVWTWKSPGRPLHGRMDGSQHGWMDSAREGSLDVGKGTHGAAMALTVPMSMIPVHSGPGSLVFEPFSGSGTTLIAAHRLGRTCYGCELEPKYADVILRRAEAEGLTCERAE